MQLQVWYDFLPDVQENPVRFSRFRYRVLMLPHQRSKLADFSRIRAPMTNAVFDRLKASRLAVRYQYYNHLEAA